MIPAPPPPPAGTEPVVSWGLSGGPWTPWTQIEQPDKLGLVFHGGAEYDVGYAKWTYDSPAQRPEDFYDARGRFVLGPSLQHDFGRNWFVRGTGQVVVWLREQYNLYQINADDVYAQFGMKDLWDLQVGRFMSWRVYQKGLGYDLYTLEDTGDLRTNGYPEPMDATKFYPHTYEVNDIFMRGTPGRAAVHAYPTKWSGIEILGQYGKNGNTNALGGRVAAGVNFPFLAASVGAETTTQRAAVQQGQFDSTGVFVECPNCNGRKTSHGYGGSAVFKLAGLVRQIPLEIAGGAAERRNDEWGLVDGLFANTASGKTRTWGGFAQLDVGTMTFKKGLILGVGLQHTEFLADNGDFQSHQQNAYYVAYPLGFNNAMVKFVLSTARGDLRPENGTVDGGRMIAGRLRFSFSF